MDVWHSNLYACLGLLFGGDPTTSASQQNEANLQLIELIGEVQSDVMIDVYVDILTKAHDNNFRTVSSSTHALFWASSGLRGLIQLPKTWLEYGSDRQGLILNTLLKLLSLCNELDQIVLRQITDSISCIAILMISDWNTMFDDLFSACQVTSVETLQEEGGYIRVVMLLNIIGGIAEYASKLLHMITVEHYNHMINKLHQKAFQTYVHPFIFSILSHIMSSSGSSLHQDKVICACMDCLLNWASCDVGNSSVQIIESHTSWAPLIMSTTTQGGETCLLDFVINLILNPQSSSGSTCFMKAVDLLDQWLQFPLLNSSDVIYNVINFEPILSIFLQLLKSNDYISNELYLRYLSKIFFTLFDKHGESLFLNQNDDDLSIYSSTTITSPTPNNNTLSNLQTCLLEALMLCTRYQQDLEFIAVPSLECWCNIIYYSTSNPIFNIQLIQELVNSILTTCMLPAEESQESWMLLKYNNETCNDSDVLDGLLCYRIDATDTLLALFDMKDIYSAVDGVYIVVGNIILETLKTCSSCAFENNQINAIEVVLWASCLFVEPSICQFDNDDEDGEYGGEYGDEEEGDGGDYYGPSSSSSIAFQTPTKGTNQHTSSTSSPSFLTASSIYQSPTTTTKVEMVNMSPHQLSISKWKDWFLELIQTLSSMQETNPHGIPPLIACSTSELYKELSSPLLEIQISNSFGNSFGIDLLFKMIHQQYHHMISEATRKPACQCILKLIKTCSNIMFKFENDLIENVSRYHHVLLTLIEDLHVKIIPCLEIKGSTVGVKDFHLVLRTCIALTCLTYLDINTSSSLQNKEAEEGNIVGLYENTCKEICRFISPYLNHIIQSLTLLKTKHDESLFNFTCVSSIQHIEYALGIISSNKNNRNQNNIKTSNILSITLMSCLWPYFINILNLCEEISQLFHPQSSIPSQLMEMISLTEDSIFGCLSILFQLIQPSEIINNSTNNNMNSINGLLLTLYQHVEQLVSNSLKKPFKQSRYLPSSLITLISHLYTSEFIHYSCHVNEDQSLTNKHDMLVLMINRISSFNDIVASSSSSSSIWTNPNTLQLGCNSILEANVEACVSLFTLIKDVMHTNSQILTLKQDISFIQSLWFLIIISIHHACSNMVTTCSPLIRVSSSLFKDMIMSQQLDLSIYLNNESIGFMLTTLFHALGRFNQTSTATSSSTSSSKNLEIPVNAFFIRFISDILYTLLYDNNVQPYIRETCHVLLLQEASVNKEDELLSLILSKEWYERDGRVNKQKFMKFISQVSIVWSGKALPQSAIDLLR